ncbi:hypothetical protein COCMIDRAFT_88397 [Bipolaris oryzae ATCC 44560]|uniref:Uncharacterized protein n=1 Tax=Bipolaris oryzae ATCC 44560 TaxID=930090 RepID=W6ZDR5_COCMI|nr:uncharacterized protein COCMIDRAFT_88397 [Bipolaris oryzae ATCC 44560]EUC48033.1 hypothetical protein COCMIDRAFT_88397 [Bipolaris oryzae ATCC 44560]
MAKNNRLPHRVRLGVVSIRFPEAHFSWAPQGMMFMSLGLWFFVFFFTPKAYLDIVIVRPFYICLFYTFLGYFPLIKTGTSCLSPLFLQKIVCLSSSSFSYSLKGGKGRSLYCLLVFYPFQYEGIDHTRDKIHC